MGCLKGCGYCIAAFLLFGSSWLYAGEISIAVASNFSKPMQKISRLFEANTGHKVILSIGATGKHYTQIHHGAPFDLFFAADSNRPALLEKDGMILSGSRFTYAIGQLVLWSPKNNYVDSQGKILRTGKFQHLAIANPRLAPYGKAAQEVLQRLGLWERLKQQAVRGENIGQAFQFVKSGNAELGFVAWSQLQENDSTISGSYWKPSTKLYSPIEQQAVQISQSTIAQDFMAFVKTPMVASLIRQYGYHTP